MDTKALYREILNDHNVNPSHKNELTDATVQLNGVNPSCGDNITLFLNINNGIITGGSFTGSGCAVSQASVDMMLDLVIGKSVEEAESLYSVFTEMIKGNATDENLEKLEEAAALQDISHMPSRVKCAELGWRTMDQMLKTPLAQAVIKKTASLPHIECAGN